MLLRSMDAARSGMLALRSSTAEADALEQPAPARVLQQRLGIERGGNVLVGTPGRLDDLMVRLSEMVLRELDLLILDEADRLLDMGSAVAPPVEPTASSDGSSPRHGHAF